MIWERKQKKWEKSLSSSAAKSDTRLSAVLNALAIYIMERERVFYEASCRPIDPYYVDQYQIWLTNHVMKTDQNYDLVARKSLTSHLKSAEPHWAVQRWKIKVVSI